MSHTRTLEELSFDNSYARLPEAFYAKLNPTSFGRASVSCQFQSAAAELIDLDPEQAKRPECAGVFGGSLLVPGMEPLAMLYFRPSVRVYVRSWETGAQSSLEKYVNERGEKWDLASEGAGLTPFPARGRCRAVLRSTIREYLCQRSDAWSGIRRLGGSVSSGADHQVYREQVETGAMLVRMAPFMCASAPLRSSITVNSMSSSKSSPTMSSRTTFPTWWMVEQVRAILLRGCQRTAKLIAQWQAVGWAHGS